MFSVLIVDDEEPVLESYEFMLNSYQADDENANLEKRTEHEPKVHAFRLAGKARTGYEALKLIYETEPDLVFMDINIPGIDGLSVLEEVHKKYPRMVCVLSTAYERFDLARRAIPLGVFTYLVKPVSKKTFFTTLENALVQLRSLPPEDTSAEEPKLRFLRKDIWGAIGEEKWRSYKADLELSSDKGLALLVECEKETEKNCALIAEKLSFKYHCLYDVMLNRGLFLISENLDGVRRHWEDTAAGLFPDGTIWFWGLGGLYCGPELYRSCGEALAELEERRGRTDAGKRDRLMIINLREKIGIVPPEETQALFTGIWESALRDALGQTGAADGTAGEGDENSVRNNFPVQAKTAMVSLFTLLLDDITGAWQNPEAPLPFHPSDIMKLEDTGAWKRWADLHFEKLLLLAAEKRSGNFPIALVKAMDFIREHYAEGIQLGDAAQAALVSPAHLSRLFTEHLKTTFVDYLTGLRISAAEKLLKDSAMTVKDIAYAVGYQDPNYFSKAFKRITGRLPRER
ncbi:hypothetical protein FACS1894161_2680 [Spirochaetia bacterium]|nr:hypothetical protein FACS1894161_2680 [Spirochaetia bacterium]